MDTLQATKCHRMARIVNHALSGTQQRCDDLRNIFILVQRRRHFKSSRSSHAYNTDIKCMARSPQNQTSVAVPSTPTIQPINALTSITKLPPLYWAVGAGIVAVALATVSLTRQFISGSRRRTFHSSSSPPLSSTDRAAIEAMAPLLLAAETAASIDETALMSLKELQDLELNLRMLITSMDAQLTDLQQDLAARLTSSDANELDLISQQRSDTEEQLDSTSSSASVSLDSDQLEKKLSNLQWTEFSMLTSNTSVDEDKKRTYRSLLFNKNVQSQLLRQVLRQLEERSQLQQHQEQQQTTSFDDSQINPNSSTQHLIVGGCMIPHPSKQSTGGEDAFFISQDTKAFGVADGVGGWINNGVDPSIYPRKLMAQCQDNARKYKDPYTILRQSFAEAHAPGSCTVALATLNDGNVLKIVSLGDCGVRILRRGKVVLATDIQEHKFNQPYQLASPEHYVANVPDDALRYDFVVQHGDVVVMGTDGLWDNMWNDEVEEILINVSPESPSVEHAARYMAEVAAQHAGDTSFESPFAKEKHEKLVPGAMKSAVRMVPGGKLDDITCLVALIV